MEINIEKKKKIIEDIFEKLDPSEKLLEKVLLEIWEMLTNKTASTPYIDDMSYRELIDLWPENEELDDLKQSVLAKKLKLYKRKPIGSGHFGNVFLLEKKIEPVVEKVIYNYDNFHEVEINKLLSRYPIENVVKFFNSTIENGVLYLYTEYCDGGNLTTYAKSNPVDMKDFCRQISTGLAAIHVRFKWVHRDIKPDNIMVSTESEVPIYKIGDFGLCRRVNEKSVNIEGTPVYMSPEQLKNDPSQPSMDIWAFGNVLCSLFTGKPFTFHLSREISSIVHLMFLHTQWTQDLLNSKIEELEIFPEWKDLFKKIFVMDAPKRSTALDLNIEVRGMDKILLTSDIERFNAVCVPLHRFRF